MREREIVHRLEELAPGDVFEDEPLSKHTSWKTGGPADILAVPRSAEVLTEIVRLATQENVPLTVLGNGTNVLVRDGGIEGLVLKTCGLQSVSIKDTVITAGAGVSLIALSRAARDHCLEGLEFAVGIPGSIGGAVVTNAGAHGACVGDVVTRVEAVDRRGKRLISESCQLGFGYRSSALKDSGNIVCTVEICLRKTKDGQRIKQMMAEYVNYRKAKQPVGPATAGSVFANPPGEVTAASLIERAGLKGLSSGDAEISRLHANFIINHGEAKAADILRLIETARERVKGLFGVELRTEVQILGRGP